MRDTDPALPQRSSSEIPEQTNQGQQVLEAEYGTSGGDGHERIGRPDIRPRGRQRLPAAICPMEADAILTPGVPVGHERELMSVQRMIGVRYPKGL